MTGQEAARILDGDSAMSGEAHPSQADAEPPFVGRHRQLDALETALQESQARHRDGRLCARPVRHREERAGPMLPRSRGEPRGHRCAAWPLLRVRIGAIQGARRRHRQPQSTVERPATIAGRSAASARSGGVVTALSRHAAGRGGSVRAPARTEEHRSRSSCGSEPLQRCANC